MSNRAMKVNIRKNFFVYKLPGIAFVWRSTRGCRSRRNAVAPPQLAISRKKPPAESSETQRRTSKTFASPHVTSSPATFSPVRDPPPRPDWIPPAHVLNSTAFQMALLWSWCAQLITACLTGPSGKSANPRPTTHVPFPTSTRLCHKARGCAGRRTTPGPGHITFPTPKGVVPSFRLGTTPRERHGTYLRRRNPALFVTVTSVVLVDSVGTTALPMACQGLPTAGVASNR